MSVINKGRTAPAELQLPPGGGVTSIWNKVHKARFLRG